MASLTFFFWYTFNNCF